MSTHTTKPANAAPAASPDSNSALKSLFDSVSYAAENIRCATCVIRDLLRIAIQEVERTTGTRAESVIRAAEKYIGDIEKITEHLDSLERAAQKGGAV